MALLYMDGFDLQDTTMRWVLSGASADILYTATPRFTVNPGKAVSLNPVSGGGQANLTILRALPASASLYVGAAIQVGLEVGTWTGNPTANLFGIYGDGGSTGHMYLRRLSNNALVAYRGDPNTGYLGSVSGAQIATTAAGVLDGNWHFIELFATINATTGQLIVKVDGVQVINFTGNTKNGGTSTNIDAIRFRTGTGNASPNCVITIDDFYACDATGTVNNTFLGDIRVQSMIPNAAGSSTQLAPTGSVNNYANAGESPYNDATYNASSTVGQRDTYALSDLAAGTTTIFGIQSVAHMQKSDAGTANAKVALKSGASVYYDNTQSLGTTSTAYTQVRETDPATSAAWAVANANALEAGMEVA